jgi:AcrR family transcriptional regulator
MGSRERRARHKENVREEILDAARALFLRKGYNNVSIREIADQIEYAPGTIYLYFKDKADIAYSMCAESFAKLHARLNAIVNDSGDPLDRLRRAGRRYIHFGLENPEQYFLTFVSREMPKLEPHQKAVGMDCLADLNQIVQQCIDAGLLRMSDIAEVSQVLWGCVHGITSLLITHSDFPFLEQSRLIDTTLDLAIEGVRKKKKEFLQ